MLSRFMKSGLIACLALLSVTSLRADDIAPQKYEVVAPPEKYGLNPFYKKHISAQGFPIFSSGNVNDYALKEACYIVNIMLAKRPDVRAAMIENGSRLTVIAYNEYTTDIPEHAHFTPKEYMNRRARGTGGSETDPVCTCAEENVLGYEGDPYAQECILIHEFAHCIHIRGMNKVDPTFDERLKKAYDDAMAKGLWKGVYASTNHFEYFAEGVQSWFDNNRHDDHDHNHVDTRAELLEYDPALAGFCREVFRDTELSYTKPATRLTGHLQGYDPKQSPTFRWPKELAELGEKIKNDVVKKRKQRAEEKNANAATKD